MTSHPLASKTRPYSQWRALCCVLATVLLTLNPTTRARAQPQPEEGERWYQIEILVFANIYERGDSEVWRQDLKLRYPYNWTVLKDPDMQAPVADAPVIEGLRKWELPEFEASEEAGETSLESSTDESMNPAENQLEAAASVATTPMPDELEPAATVTTAPPADTSQFTSLFSTDSTDTSEELQAIDLDRQPFYLLPEEQRNLEREAGAIRRSREYRLLLHQAWRQPVQDDAKAPFLLISAGDKFGEHQELEGSLSVSVSRYLHLRTNLWFSRFTHNFGQPRVELTDLPVRPDRRQYPGPGGVNQTQWQGLTDFDEILTTPYVPERISLIEQRRRMRSDELHFIDHPHLGILILCKPYELPMEEADTSEGTGTDNTSAEEAGTVKTD